MSVSYTHLDVYKRQGYSSVNQNSIIPSKTFIVDSGCTPNHMTNDLSILENVKSCNKDISVVKKNQSMQSLAVGYVDSEQCILKNVSYVPELSNNLMSVNAITENGGVRYFVFITIIKLPLSLLHYL